MAQLWLFSHRDIRRLNYEIEINPLLPEPCGYRCLFLHHLLAKEREVRLLPGREGQEGFDALAVVPKGVHIAREVGAVGVDGLALKHGEGGAEPFFPGGDCILVGNPSTPTGCGNGSQKSNFLPVALLKRRRRR
jgi:hypothetical protein